MNDAGKVAFSPKGKYSSTTTYEYLDTVVYNGNAYVALKTTTGNAPTDSDTDEYWRLFDLGVKISSSSEITKAGEYALDAREKNASVDGTLANKSKRFDDIIGSEVSEYDSTESYGANDIVVHEGKLYRSRVKIGAATGPITGDFDINSWEEVNAIELLERLHLAKNISLDFNVMFPGESLLLGQGYDNVNYAVNRIITKTIELRNNIHNITHNIPRVTPKDITSYYEDGTLWRRLNGTDGFLLFDDIFVGDYFKMSRPISAYNQNQSYQTTGSQYVTIAGIDTMCGNGDNIAMAYHHLVMVPGMGFDGTQHFGRSRMNSSNTTVGGYIGSEMYATTIGDIATSGSIETTATINQQLFAEFGSHLKTTRELLSNSLNSTGTNRFGESSGCANNWGWYSCQAVLMSEVEVYGSVVWSSSGFDTGNANKQLPLFANSKQAINNRSAWYWLKSIASASDFCCCSNDGYSYYGGASAAYGYVRPRFVIAA